MGKRAIILLIVVLIFGGSLTAYQLGFFDNFSPLLSPTGAPGESLLLHYKFDYLTGSGPYGIVDSSGNSRGGIVTNVLDVQGVRNRGLRFNGDGYGFVGGSDINPDGTFSIEAWVRPRDSGSGINTAQIIVSDRVEGLTGESVALQLNPDGKPVFAFSDSGNGANKKVVTGANVLEKNKWHHVVGTVDSNLMKLYVDGVVAGQTNSDGRVPYNNPNPFFIGAHNGTSTNGGIQRFLRGDIDDFAFYDIVLSDGDVALKYRSEMQLYYPFETIANSITNDLSGNERHGEANGATLEAGIKGNAVVFNGSNYVKVGTASSYELNFENEFAISLWLWMTNTTQELNQTTQRIFDNSVGGVSWASYNLRINNDTKLEFVIHPFANSSAIGSFGNTRVEKNKWNHIVTMIKNDKLEIYLNGVLESSVNLGGLRPYYSENSLYIGAQQWQSGAFVNNFRGKIDELRVYERSLDSVEISNFCVPLINICSSNGHASQCTPEGYGYNVQICSNGCSNGQCNPSSGTGGGSGSGSGGASCVPTWSCSWGPCINGEQKKSCVDSRNCNIVFNKPNETIRSCAPELQCTDNDHDGYGEGIDCLGHDLDDSNPLITSSQTIEDEVIIDRDLVNIVPYLISALFLILAILFVYFIVVHMKKNHKKKDDDEDLIKLKAVRMIIDARNRGYTNELLINYFKERGWTDDEMDKLFKEADRVQKMSQFQRDSEN